MRNDYITLWYSIRNFLGFLWIEQSFVFLSVNLSKW
jgi:hypothetical protein